MDGVINFADHHKTSDQASADIIRRDRAVAQVRTYHLEEFLATVGAAVPLAMNAGDCLAEFKDTAGHGRWLPFLRECGLHKRTAQIYVQLAAKRAIIDEEMRRTSSPLSIASALRLIRQPKPKQPKPKTQDPAVDINIILGWLAQATQADKRRLATALAQDAEAMRAILPAKTLPAKATPQQVFEKAMGLLSADEAPPTTH